MKKYILLLIVGLTMLNLTACQKSEKTTEYSQSTSTEKKSSTSPSSSSDSENSSKPSSSSKESIHTSEGSESNLGKARIAIYQAGIDSSALSDEDVLRLWNRSAKDKVDFISLVKEELAKK
ncbi:hypothetical protein [Lactococcus garvieae]|uniref:Lipoprotein n=1 Tax=Lactococcus garvieae DCC43 TaxID=1231377 RepID=K2QG93_9LACT|nr:hypothetical protein [Lactococcus garvieae]EKF52522.1 hypothetical protein C426_0097 [Lactococcus garvieae DCC43]